jgi:hypothetical protein
MEEKWPKTFWAFIVCFFIEIILVVCLVPNNFIERSILKEQGWTQVMLGEASEALVRKSTDQLYISILGDSGIKETVSSFFIPSEAEIEKSKGWERLGELWFPFIQARGEALAMVIYHIIYRIILLGMWIPSMIIMVVPSMVSGYMAWQIKRYNFAYSSPFLNKYSSMLLMFFSAALIVSFIAPLPIPPMIIPIMTIIVIPFACVLLLGNLPKRL